MDPTKSFSVQLHILNVKIFNDFARKVRIINTFNLANAFDYIHSIANHKKLHVLLLRKRNLNIISKSISEIKCSIIVKKWKGVHVGSFRRKYNKCFIMLSIFLILNRKHQKMIYDLHRLFIKPLIPINSLYCLITISSLEKKIRSSTERTH